MNFLLDVLSLTAIGILSVFFATGVFWILLGNWQEFWLGVLVTSLFGGALWFLLTRKVVR